MKPEYVSFAEEMFAAQDADFGSSLQAFAYSNGRITSWLRSYMYLIDTWFFHLGVTCWVASANDTDEYWYRLGSEFSTFPRESERRHFRGQAGMKALLAAKTFSNCPPKLVEHWFQDRTYKGFSARVKGFPQIGPYIRFDMYDVAERTMPWLGLEPIPLEGVDLYKSPLEGAKMLAKGDETVEQTAQRIIEECSHINAPPFFDRAFGPQEVETLFCRWKKYKKGTYQIGDDKKHVLKQMEWRNSWLMEIMRETAKCL